jgi:hypothetical protein
MMTLGVIVTGFPWFYVAFSFATQDAGAFVIKSSISVVVAATFVFGSSYFLLRFVVRKFGTPLEKKEPPKMQDFIHSPMPPVPFFGFKSDVRSQLHGRPVGSEPDTDPKRQHLTAHSQSDSNSKHPERLSALTNFIAMKRKATEEKKKSDD